MNRQIIQAENLHKFYNHGQERLHVLKGINLEIEPGEVLGICGPSGAGKSTLLHILGGLDKPDKGRVLLRDKDLSGLRELERTRILNQEVGFVFQFYHLLAEFSCLENVMLPAIINRCNFNSARTVANNLLEKLGLSSRISHKPSELSGGEQQRVAIARSLINRPKVLFCDEPTGNLDSVMGQRILGLLRDFNRDLNITIIMVTHQEDLIKFADRLIHIKDGVLQN